MATATFQIWRGNNSGGKFETYSTEIAEGMVVLDAVVTPERKVNASGTTPPGPFIYD